MFRIAFFIFIVSPLTCFAWFMFVNKYIDKSNDVTRQQKNRCLRFHFEVNQHSHRTPGANLKLRHFNGNNLDVMQLKTNESTRFSFCYCCCSLSPAAGLCTKKKQKKTAMAEAVIPSGFICFDIMHRHTTLFVFLLNSYQHDI